MNTTKIRKGAKESDIQHKKEIFRDPMYICTLRKPIQTLN